MKSNEVVCRLKKGEIFYEGGLLFLRDLFPKVQALILAGETQRDFTPQEALEEAKKRWGKDAIAHFQSWLEKEPCLVGKNQATLRRDWKGGFGKTFRAAFAAADKDGSGE